jgi:hypothetical protein
VGIVIVVNFDQLTSPAAELLQHSNINISLYDCGFYVRGDSLGAFVCVRDEIVCLRILTARVEEKILGNIHGHSVHGHRCQKTSLVIYIERSVLVSDGGFRFLVPRTSFCERVNFETLRR